jgi:hypothetical protein
MGIEQMERELREVGHEVERDLRDSVAPSVRSLRPHPSPPWD